MKTRKLLLIPIFLLLCSAAFAQTVVSSVTISFSGGKYVVSGVVESEAIRNELIEKINRQLGSNGSSAGILVKTGARPFREDWRANFDQSLAKVKGWKTGVFIFSDQDERPDVNYPPLPPEMADPQITLIDGRTLSLEDYRNKVVVLYFYATWCGPCIPMADALNKFYVKNSARPAEIFALNTDEEESGDVAKYVRLHNYRFPFGATDARVYDAAVRLSRLDGIPQAIVTYNGRLYGVFAGGSPRVEGKLEETVLKILDDNGL